MATEKPSPWSIQWSNSILLPSWLVQFILQLFIFSVGIRDTTGANLPNDRIVLLVLEFLTILILVFEILFYARLITYARKGADAITVPSRPPCILAPSNYLLFQVCKTLIWFAIFLGGVVVIFAPAVSTAATRGFLTPLPSSGFCVRCTILPSTAGLGLVLHVMALVFFFPSLIYACVIFRHRRQVPASTESTTSWSKESQQSSGETATTIPDIPQLPNFSRRNHYQERRQDPPSYITNENASWSPYFDRRFDFNATSPLEASRTHPALSAPSPFNRSYSTPILGRDQQYHALGENPRADGSHELYASPALPAHSQSAYASNWRQRLLGKRIHTPELQELSGCNVPELPNHGMSFYSIFHRKSSATSRAHTRHSSKSSPSLHQTVHELSANRTQPSTRPGSQHPRTRPQSRFKGSMSASGRDLGMLEEVKGMEVELSTSEDFSDRSRMGSQKSIQHMLPPNTYQPHPRRLTSSSSSKSSRQRSHGKKQKGSPIGSIGERLHG